jgi:hypothetical protein
MDINKTWQPQWPEVTSVVNGQDPRSRPAAVEITIETEDWGKVVRIIEIAG